MLHGKNFKCHVGLCIFQQYFLRMITACNVFPSPPWLAPFLWGIVLQAALLNCCLSSIGSIQHLWSSMNVIFESCKVLWRWKETIDKCKRIAARTSVLSQSAGTPVSQSDEQIWLKNWLGATKAVAVSGQLRDVEESVAGCPRGSELLNPLCGQTSVCTHSHGLYCE